ncbi:unnamed protein product [Boreogadus saida]
MDTTVHVLAHPRALGRTETNTTQWQEADTETQRKREREREIALGAAAVEVVSISQGPLKCVAQGRLVFLVFRRVVAQTAAGHFLTCPARLQEEGGGSFEGLDEHQEDPG